MIKYIFFVTTVGSIYDAVLPLIEEKKDKGEILVIAATDEAELFFSEFTDYKIIHQNLNPNLIIRNNKKEDLKPAAVEKLLIDDSELAK